MCRVIRGLTVAIAISALFTTFAHADFLIGGFGSAYLVNDDGQVVRQYGQALAFPGGNQTESVDAFALSNDGETVYVFGNDLGGITNFGFDFSTGELEGIIGTPTPGIYQPWFNGFVGNYGIRQPLVRRDVPSGSGDLLYIGRISPVINPPALADKNLLNIVDSSDGIRAQILPPAPAEINDFTVGPGPLGSQSRIYLATNLGVFYYDEVISSGGTGFVLGSSVPLIAEQVGQIEYGPDGLLYTVPSDPPPFNSGINPIHRFDASTGSFVDTFLTEAEINPDGSFDGMRISMGPNGQLYVMRGKFDVTLGIASYHLQSGQLNGVTQMNGLASDAFEFLVLPVPEPSSFAVVITCLAAMCVNRRVSR
jgi:hypothetical protein